MRNELNGGGGEGRNNKKTEIHALRDGERVSRRSRQIRDKNAPSADSAAACERENENKYTYHEIYPSIDKPE